MSFLRKITRAYSTGKEYSEIQENLAWIGREKVLDKKNYDSTRQFWNRRSEELSVEIKAMSLIEKIAFMVGEDVVMISTPYPLEQPHPRRI